MDLLGLASAPEEEIASHITKRSLWDDLATNEKRLNIYFRPSRKVQDQMITEELLQIDCHVPKSQDIVAYQVQGRVKALLHNYEVNGRAFYFDGQLGELPTMQGFISVGSRYRFYITI